MNSVPWTWPAYAHEFFFWHLILGLATPLRLSSLSWPVLLLYKCSLFISPYTQSGPVVSIWACPLVFCLFSYSGPAIYSVPNLSFLACHPLLCMSSFLACLFILGLSPYFGPVLLFLGLSSFYLPALLFWACPSILYLTFWAWHVLSFFQIVCPLILGLSFLSGPISEFAVSKTPNHVSLVSLVSRVTRQDSGWGQTLWWILAGRTKNCPVQASLSTPLQATLKIQICVWSVLLRMLRSVLTEMSILAQLWSIRQLHDFDQAAPWPIRPLPDFDQAAAWPIRQQPEYHIFWFSLI